MPKIIVGRKSDLLARFFEELGAVSATKKGRDFCKREARYFLQASKNCSDEKKYKGTISKMN